MAVCSVLTVQLDLLKIAASRQVYENTIRNIAQLEASAHTHTVGSNVNFTTRTSHAVCVLLKSNVTGSIFNIIVLYSFHIAVRKRREREREKNEEKMEKYFSEKLIS